MAEAPPVRPLCTQKCRCMAPRTGEWGTHMKAEWLGWVSLAFDHDAPQVCDHGGTDARSMLDADRLMWWRYSPLAHFVLDDDAEGPHFNLRPERIRPR